MSQNIDTLRLLTQQILNIEGSLSPKAWTGAKTAFGMWTCHPVTQEGAEWGWKLLDRLVEDEWQNDQKRLTVGWLHRMVGVYSDGELDVDPQQVLARLEAYADVLNVDETTISMLQGMKMRVGAIGGQEQSLETNILEPLKALEMDMQATVTNTAVVEEREQSIASFASASTRSDESHAQKDRSSAIALARQETFIEEAAKMKKEAESSESSMSEQPTSSKSDFQTLEGRTHSLSVRSMSTADWEDREERLMNVTGNEAFRLLDSLVKGDPQRATTEWLNRIVQSWFGKRIIQPTQLLVKLNDYAPLPDVNTYVIIVSAIQRTRFLELPAGSMTQVDWNEADAMLRSMTSESASSESISSAWKVLDRLIEEEKHGREESCDYQSRLHPDWLNRIVEAWCRCSMKSAAEPAEILVRMNHYAPHISPDPYIYQMIVDSVRKASQPPSRNATRKEPVADSIVIERTPTSRRVPTTAAMYHVRIQELMANSRDRWRNADNAEAMLEEMWDLYNAGNWSVKPDTVTYNTVIKALVESRHPSSGERAEALLMHMEECVGAGDLSVKPDSVTYTSVMRAWSHSQRPDRAEKAEALFRRMRAKFRAGDNDLKVDTFAFNALLTAWSWRRTPGAAERAEAILREMQELYESGDSDVKPDTMSFNMTIKACASRHGRSSKERAARVEAMLNLMESQYEAGNSSVKPNTASYNMLILAWSKCADAAEMAENVLIRMQALFDAGDIDVKPDLASYKGVLAALVRSSDEDAPDRAEMILERLEKIEDPTVKPDTVCFNSVISTLAQRGRDSDVLKAEALLGLMNDLSISSDSSVTPDPRTIAMMVSMWAKSSHESAAENAMKYLVALGNLEGDDARQRFESSYEKIMHTGGAVLF